MTLTDRNVFLASMWKELTDEERREFNRRALSEDIIAKKEQIKRILKKVKTEVMQSTIQTPKTTDRKT